MIYARLALIFALLLSALSLRADLPLPPPQSAYVNDFAGILTDIQKDQLTEKLKALRRSPGTEVTLVTLPSIHAYGFGSDEAALAKALFNRWGVGDASRNDGVMVLLAMEERVVRIALGSGYAPVWDGRAKRVIDAVMVPLLREGETARALSEGLDALDIHLLTPHRNGQTFDGFEGMPADPQDEAGLVDEILFGGVVAFIFGVIGWQQRVKIGDQILRLRGCPSCGRRGIEISRTPQVEGSDILVTRHCPHCGWGEGVTEEPPPERDRSESGNDGFGGGNSSGGGASGNW